MVSVPSATARTRSTSTSRSTLSCREPRLSPAFYSVSLAHERHHFLHALLVILLDVAARIKLAVHRHQVGILALQDRHEVILGAAVHVHHHRTHRGGARIGDRLDRGFDLSRLR